MDMETFEVIKGLYNITETLPTGWRQASVQCIDLADNSTLSTTGVVRVGPMQNIQCEFTNEKTGTLSIKKTTLDGFFDTC